MSQTIVKSTVVELHFTLKNKSGDVIDSSDGQKPLTYLHGHNNLVPGLEKALQGCKVGDKKHVELAPEDGYGPINPSLKMDIPRTQFPANEKIEPGMQFEGVNTEGQTIIFVVNEVGLESVSVDGNHPLAGQTLCFDVEVAGVRAATEEELQHGHAHEPGGHHHH